jgi:tripartite-type tricarboxylate transporter receptor subunit TctC
MLETAKMMTGRDRGFAAAGAQFVHSQVLPVTDKLQGSLTMILPRRHFPGLAGIAAALACPSRFAYAQTWPTRPITLVVPVAPGGALDGAARILSENLREKLEQPVIVENRAGAGSLIGTGAVAKAAPDGHTLLLMEPGAILAKWFSKSVPFDVLGDFSPVAMVATSPVVLFAHPTAPFGDVKELISYSKANPGKLTVGTPGVGTPHHLAAAWMNTAANIDITHVPYRGAALALNDLLGGQLPLIWATPVSVMPFVEQGKVKVLAVSTPRRDRLLPQAPTVSESALPGFDVDIFYGIAAPARVAPEIVARLGRSIRDVVDLPGVQKRLATLGLNLEYRNSDQFRELIARDHQKYAAIIREAGIQPG